MEHCPAVKKPELGVGSATRGEGEDLTAEPLWGQAISVNKSIKTRDPGFGDTCVCVSEKTDCWERGGPRAVAVSGLEGGPRTRGRRQSQVSALCERFDLLEHTNKQKRRLITNISGY